MSPIRSMYLLIAAVAALACLSPTQSARADEPHVVTVALLFPVGETPPECLEDPIGIAFGAGGSVSNSKQKTLSSVFGVPFGNENLNAIGALYVSRGGVGKNVVRGFGSAMAPPSGFMLLGPSRDAEVLYCGFVSDDINILYPDELGELLLVIVSGTVH